GHSATVRSMQFLDGSSSLASLAADETLHIWDVRSGHMIQTIQLQGMRSLRLACHSGRIVVGSSDGMIDLWDVDTGSLLNRWRGHNDPITNLVFTPDGTGLVSSAWTRTLDIWTVTATGHRIKNTLVGHTAKVRGVDISQDGRSLVSLSFDKTLRTWNIVTGSPVQTSRSSCIHSVNIPALIRMAPDGRSVAAGFDNEVVKLWDTETGRLLRRFKAKDEVKSIEFMPDSTGILVGDDSGKIRLLDTTRGYTRHSV
ncbi:WD40-repeat-containing domain protein, partial [Sparassis latifolia]